MIHPVSVTMSTSTVMLPRVWILVIAMMSMS
jgi:hypothetical protein